MKYVPHDVTNIDVKTTCLVASPEALKRAAEFLSAGLPVAVPTETVYGLAANALDPDAVGRIYTAKGRPADNPLIIHVGIAIDGVGGLIRSGLVQPLASASAQRVVADRLLRAFWPGPLTVVLPRGARVPDAVTAGLPTAGFRMPAHPVFLELLAHVPFPLAAPSANRSNRISPTAASHVMEELNGRIPLVLDGGNCQFGVESTIVAVDGAGRVTVLRPGSVPVEAIADCIEAPLLKVHQSETSSLAPGMRPVHYAPSRPIVLASRDDRDELIAALAQRPKLRRVGILLLRGEPLCPELWVAVVEGSTTSVRSLGDTGDGRLAAQRLFAELRALDQWEPDLIIVEAPPAFEGGFWLALRDRLSRAAAAGFPTA